MVPPLLLHRLRLGIGFATTRSLPVGGPQGLWRPVRSFVRRGGFRAPVMTQAIVIDW